MSGEVADGWRVNTLGDVALGKGEYGANVSKAEFDPALPRYVRITDISDQGDLIPTSLASINHEAANGYLLQEGDLLFARSGATVGKSFLYQAHYGPCAFAGYLIRFRLDTSKIDAYFARSVVQSADYWEWVATVQRAQAQPNINAKEYATLQLRLPPLDEQRRIAEVLRSVDEVIAAADLVVTQATEAFEALLADLFSRYADASAKLESYCLTGGLQTGPFGSQLKAEDYVEEGVPVIMPVDLTAKGMDFIGAKKAPIAKSRELARHILQPGDVLFARRGEIGRCGLYLEGDPVALCGTGCLRARLDTAKIDSALAYFLIQSRQARDWLCAHAVGATMPNLNTTIIGQLPMPDIPKDEQSAWVDALLMIEGTRRINQHILASYRQAKSTLMSDLLSGRVRVPA